MEPPSLTFPDTGTFLLHNAFVPECCLLQLQHEDEDEQGAPAEGSLGSGGHGGRGEEEGGREEQGLPPPPLTPPPSTAPSSLLLRSASTCPDLDSLVHVDIEVVDGVIREICKARPRGGVGDNNNKAGDDGFSMTSTMSSSSSSSSRRRPIVDAGCGIVFPCFVDLHTHIGTYNLPRRLASW